MAPAGLAIIQPRWAWTPTVQCNQSVEEKINPMSEDNYTLITMEDMAVVFSITDDYAIHRESVSVELAREDPGGVEITARGTVEITLPASQSPEEFAGTIRAELEARGYAHNPGQVVANESDADPGDEKDEDWLA